MAQAATDGVPVRVVVFIDSDGRYPGHVPQETQRVEDICRSHDVPCRILRKRYIESYIPDEVLSIWVNAPENRKYRAQVDALARLTQEQRDHVPIKSGLHDGNLLPEEEDLYASVDPADRVALRQGLGREIIESLKDHSTVLSAEVLRRRDHGGDLDDLVQMIVNEL